MLHLQILILLLIYHQCCTSAYIYPITCEKCSKEDMFAENEDDNVFVTDFVRNIIIPINNGICNVMMNFMEVYECLASKYFDDDFNDGNGPTFIDRIMMWFGITERSEPHLRCSYYSITIVSGSILLILGLLFSTKKMVDYFREDENFELSEGTFNKKFKMCNCKLNNTVCNYFLSFIYHLERNVYT